MKNLGIISLWCLLMAIICPGLLSCNKNTKDEPSVSEDNMKRVMLVYAVNNSSLRYDFKNDSVEISRAMKNIDLRYFQVLVFKTKDRNTTGLYKIVREYGDSIKFKEIISYPRETTSTCPTQIEKVVSDALTVYPQAKYDLVFWGHGSAWRPEKDDYNLYSNKSAPERGYGGEYNGSSSTSTSWTNIDDLADAIPDHVFEHIWFDCCYMGSIEVIYQFRNKCKIFVGYPTEVMSEGMAYDSVLPFMLRETPDPVGGADAFFKRYLNIGEPATVAVVDMEKLEPFADAARDILSDRNVIPESEDQINYSRFSGTKFLDVITYLNDMADLNGHSELKEKLQTAYEDMVLYHAASRTDFNNRHWDTSKIYCLSTFYFLDKNDDQTKYYKTLDWYDRVYR